MEVPTHLELLNPTLNSLLKLGGSASIEELAEQVIEDLHPPQEIIQQVHGKGSQTEFEYRLAWARTNLKKFGLITNSARGVWSCTTVRESAGAAGGGISSPIKYRQRRHCPGN